MSENAEAPAQNKDAVYPTKQIKTQKEWQGFIEENIPDLEADPENSARLMVSMQKGRDYVYDRFSPKFGTFNKPDIMIVLNEDKAKGSPFGSVPKADKIFVKKSWLEQFSKINPKSMCEVVRQDKSVGIYALPDQVFELAGIEETHHSLFGEIKEQEEQSVDPDDTDMASYDSQEIEYRALRWQIQYATEREFPQKTIDILRKRLDKAQMIRLRKKPQN